MGQKRLLKLFFEEPNRNFGIREIAKLAKVPKTSVSRYLKELLKEELVKKEKEGYAGNDLNPFFKIYKKIDFLERFLNKTFINY